MVNCISCQDSKHLVHIGTDPDTLMVRVTVTHCECPNVLTVDQMPDQGHGVLSDKAKKAIISRGDAEIARQVLGDPTREEVMEADAAQAKAGGGTAEPTPRALLVSLINRMRGVRATMPPSTAKYGPWDAWTAAIAMVQDTMAKLDAGK